MVDVTDAVDRIDVDAVNAKHKRELYKSRVKIFPKRVSGTFRSLKWWIMALTLGVYYITPWIRWDRGPSAPDQAVLVDLWNERFYFFFIEIWPQEFFYVAGLLIMAGIGLFLVTSTVGRAWCGYTCPQTVWVDLFLVVERWIEGDRNARMKLDKEPWSSGKLRKLISKHILWLAIAVATGGAWIFYFADAPTLAVNLVTLQSPLIAYSTIGVLTATTYVFAGFMREQVCTYMCPWPRIQAAMLDEDSLTVTYNGWRGETRARQKERHTQPDAQFGDCIDCNLCVAVCPQGIDIRDGQQLECITCALCIDACDSVMTKIGKPRGLISYATLKDYQANEAGQRTHTTWRSFVRPRTMVYITLWSVAGLAMLFMLLTRDRLDINVLHDRNPVFVALSDGGIRNGYTVKILNMEPRARSFRLSVDGIAGASLALAGSTAPASRTLQVDAEPDKQRTVKIYVTAYPAYLQGETTSFRFTVEELDGEETAHYDALFSAPKP
ncbi:MAG: cytochrome c oxidase accessory protein CcoG [Hyphomicrobiales bacterium]